MTAAIASINRPKVSSPERFGGFFALAPGAGRASVNLAWNACPPSVPLSVGGAFAGTGTLSAAVAPSAQVTSPFSR